MRGALLILAVLLLPACGEDQPVREGPPETEIRTDTPATAPTSEKPAAEPKDAPQPIEEPEWEDPEAIDLEEFLRLIKSEDAEDREWAAYRLGVDFEDTVLAASAARLVPVLETALGDTSADVRRGAATAVARIGTSADRLLPLVAALLDDPDLSVRARAADVLGQVGPRAHAHGVRLVTALTDPEAVVRHNAAHAIAALEKAPKGAEAALAERATKDPDDEVRAQAVLTLGELRIAGQAAIGAIEAALSDPHGEVRAAAVWTAGTLRLNTPTVQTRLQALADDENVEVREKVREALKRLAQDK